jgi:hypothetical protein
MNMRKPTKRKPLDQDGSLKEILKALILFERVARDEEISCRVYTSWRVYVRTKLHERIPCLLLLLLLLLSRAMQRIPLQQLQRQTTCAAATAHSPWCRHKCKIGTRRSRRDDV